MGINKVKVIKSLFVVAVIVALFFAAATHSAAIASISARGTMYAMTTKVVEVNDCVSLMMYDDEVISARYNA